jgi:hypothetical protein
MKAHRLGRRSSVLVTLVVVLLAPLAANAEAPIQKHLNPFFEYVRGGSCSVTLPGVGMITSTTPPSTVLFNRNPEDAITCAPLLAPDGHQLTLGEFVAVNGSAKVNCVNQGTHSVLHISGLVPNGVYTVWLLIFGDGVNVTDAGALGSTNPIENYFTASASGEGQLSVTTPQENLSAMGSVGTCWLDSKVELWLVYHSDNQTHGPEPGPPATWVTHARFLFP